MTGHAHVGNHASKVKAGQGIEEMLGAVSNSVTSKSAESSRKFERIPHRLVVVDDVDLSPIRHMSTLV